MAKQVSVYLTLAEADALYKASGNSVRDPDALEAIFRTPQQRAAAIRAFTKLADAIQAKKGPRNVG